MQVLGMAWCGMQDAGAIAFGAMFKTNQVRPQTQHSAYVFLLLMYGCRLSDKTTTHSQVILRL
jgi:hypothetical protein